MYYQPSESQFPLNPFLKEGPILHFQNIPGITRRHLVLEIQKAVRLQGVKMETDCQFITCSQDI